MSPNKTSAIEGGYDLTERAGGADGACGQLWLVTCAQHGGQGKYTHGHNGCANDPRARG